jgi:CDP-6-deoxy-D-xylo-4-hexulose-3-dehydrase
MLKSIENYCLASSTWDEKEINAIKNVIQSNMYTMGNYVNQFENEFAKFTNSKYCVMVNSGSSANLLMVAALFYTKDNPLQAGDEVIVPAVSWPTTYYPLSQYGLKLKFVDVDLQTLNYDLSQLKTAISEKTKLIMAVNLLGNPNDFNIIKELIKDKNIRLIEDNCESMGATLNNKQSGTFGIMGSFSSFYSHHIATMEGGLIITDDEELYHILLCLRAHGWTRNLPKFNQVCGEKSDNKFIESFRFVLPGYNVRPIEMSGAIGIEQLKKLPEFINTRRKNAKHFIELFKNNNHYIIQKEIGNSSWFGFSIIINPHSNFKRLDIINTLEKNNIETRPIVAGNFAKNEVMKYFNYSIHNNLINAEIIDTNGFFVGNHQIDIRMHIDMLYKLLSQITCGVR